MEQLINNLHATKSNAELLLAGSVIASDSQLAEILRGCANAIASPSIPRPTVCTAISKSCVSSS
jgi:hypothetical protein